MKNKITPNTFIQITARKCSDKVQPYIKAGGVYYVKGVETIKSGATVLLLDRKNHKAPIRCNADRFAWKPITRQEALDVVVREKAKKNVGQMRLMFSEQEQLQMAVVPMVVVEVAWNYANMAIQYAADHRISEVKKLTRAIRSLREEYLSNIRKDLSYAHIMDLQRQAGEFVEKAKYDFTILYHSVINMVYTQHVGIEYPELRAYAFISKQIIAVCEEYVHFNTMKVRARMGIDVPEVRLPFVSDLAVCMDAFLGDYKLVPDLPVTNAIRIFKKNLDSVEFVVKKTSED